LVIVTGSSTINPIAWMIETFRSPILGGSIQLDLWIRLAVFTRCQFDCWRKCSQPCAQQDFVLDLTCHLSNLKNVSVDLPIYGAHNMNLKGHVANFLARRQTEVEIIRALNDVSLSIKDGDRIGIVGPNGAGKTTLLRVMAGILKPSQGEATIQGSVVSMIDQGLGMDPQCSGIENIFRRGIFSQPKHETDAKSR
jgi:hypothetical protein